MVKADVSTMSNYVDDYNALMMPEPAAFILRKKKFMRRTIGQECGSGSRSPHL